MPPVSTNGHKPPTITSKYLIINLNTTFILTKKRLFGINQVKFEDTLTIGNLYGDHTNSVVM